MAVTVLFAAGADDWADYAPHLPQALAAAGLEAQVVQAAPPEAVDAIVYAPSNPLQDFTPFTRARIVQSLWAGVERVVANPTLTQPLCRMVDPGLTEGMVEYVTGHVLRHHLGMDRWIAGAPGWQQIAPPLARDRVVAMLGVGALGLACAEALAALNFRVEGWARGPKPGLPLPCHHGEAGLRDLLARADVVVTLLPRTPETEDLLDARRLGWLKPGAVIINPGRGALIDEAALLAALAEGRVSHATLDVFKVEPLPEAHPFRGHPQITITPHIAATTRAATAAQVVAENIHRAMTGAPLLHQVDRVRGY